MTIGEKIYQLRTSQKLSQEQLAFDLNVARQTISKWENNSMQPTTENVKLLCEYFNVESSYLLSDKSDNNSILEVEENSTVTSEIAVSEDNQIKQNKRKIIMIVTIFILSAVSILSLILGSVSIYSFSQSQEGYSDANYMDVNWIAIICFCIAVAALIALTILIIIIVRQKKTKKSPASDKM